MDKLLNILIIEDDEEECNEFERVISSVDGISLTGITNNDVKGLGYVKDTMPDVVILDLELHKGSGSGINFLIEMGKLNMPITPFVLVTTHNISRITHKQVRNFGADFIMVKSQDDYSAENAVAFLLSLKSTIQSSHKKIKTKKNISDESPFDKRSRLIKRVTTEIDKIGISPRVVGRSYLIDAIILKVEGKLVQIEEIADKHRKTAASVERAMQNAINNAWKSMHPEDLLLNYTARVRSDKGVPTLTEFIYHYANKLKTEY